MRAFDMSAALAAHLVLALVGLGIAGMAAGLLIAAGITSCLGGMGRRSAP